MIKAIYYGTFILGIIFFIMGIYWGKHIHLVMDMKKYFLMRHRK